MTKDVTIKTLTCPKCKSTNTKKVSVVDSKWVLGEHKCISCNYQAHWTEFAHNVEKEK